MSKRFDLEAYKAFEATAFAMREEKDPEANNAAFNAASPAHRVSAFIADRFAEKVSNAIQEQYDEAQDLPQLMAVPESTIIDGLLNSMLCSLAKIVVAAGDMGRDQAAVKAITQHVVEALPTSVDQELAFRQRLAFEDQMQRQAVTQMLRGLGGEQSAPKNKPVMN